MLSGIFLVLLILCSISGIICITINLVRLNFPAPETKIIYRYMPRTFEEEQNNQPFV